MQSKAELGCISENIESCRHRHAAPRRHDKITSLNTGKICFGSRNDCLSCMPYGSSQLKRLLHSFTEVLMGVVIGISRYILPFITLVILIKCMLSLLLGHPKEKTYGYIVDTLDGERYALNMWETSIGRSSSCDVVIGYDTVSRFQAVISRRIDGWYIYDLLSKSGILVNGEKIDKKATISGGDMLTFGNAQYRFEIADDPVQLVGKKRRSRKSQPMPGTPAKREAPPQAPQNSAAASSVGNAAPPIYRNIPAGYYDDENRPALHFEKTSSSSYDASPFGEVQTAGNEIYSNRITPEYEGEQNVSTPAAPAGRDFSVQSPTVFNLSTGDAYVLSGNEVSIGRGTGCDIRLSSPAVSRKHALLVLYEDGWAIEDCGSGSGTFLAGNRVTSPQLLFNGDIITIGDERLCFSSKVKINQGRAGK